MKRNIVLVFIVLIMALACNRDPEMIQTSLVITTVDEGGGPVSGVSVELYYSLDDWLNESSKLYETIESDIEGKASFMDIDTGKYYINAYKGSSNNWETEVLKSVIEGFQNTTDITVIDNGSGLISQASGKKWILSSFFTNGGDFYEFLDDCVKDDTLIFFKGPGLGAHRTSRGSLKCTISQEDNIDGLWTLLDDNSLLRLQFGNDIINWNIDTLKVEKLSVSYVESGNIQNVSYIPIE